MMADHRVLKVGAPKKSSSVVRIVHISDTHLEHEALIPHVPNGDILIHSGDFFNFETPCGDPLIGLKREMKKIDRFFEMLPHKHKIYVAGNHDSHLELFARCPTEIASCLPHGIYLHDEMVELFGLKIYGTPWNNSYAMAFYKNDRSQVWEKVPSDTDILVTHIPPFGIMDYGGNKFWDGKNYVCEFCTAKNPRKTVVYHGSYGHQGCPQLREAVFSRIRPMAHLFGHVHNQAGSEWHDKILFSNGSVRAELNVNIIEVYKKNKSPPASLKSRFVSVLFRK